jgi:small subunit ribosomal protein S13
LAKEDEDKKPKEKPKGKKTKDKGGEEKPKEKKIEVKEDFKYIVRIAETDLDGYKGVVHALTKIPGVGLRIANIMADRAKVPRNEIMGNLSDEQVDALIESLDQLPETAPDWLLNRQKDLETGDDLHLTSTELMTYFRDDINRLKKIRCYRGIRHERGKKVRGQRTRANGRRGLALGVVKGKAKAQTTSTTGKKEEK